MSMLALHIVMVCVEFFQSKRDIFVNPHQVLPLKVFLDEILIDTGEQRAHFGLSTLRLCLHLVHIQVECFLDAVPTTLIGIVNLP